MIESMWVDEGEGSDDENDDGGVALRLPMLLVARLL